MDPALTDLGHAQAAVAACNFIHSVMTGEDKFPEALASSRLGRAKDTAKWFLEAMKRYISSGKAEEGTEMPVDIEVEVSDPFSNHLPLI